MLYSILPAPPSKEFRRLQPVIFISGSASINKLPACAIKKIDSIMSGNLVILIGDAKGADLEVQKYLSEKKYDKVIVYFTGRESKNNVGGWETKKITGGANAKGRDLYALKESAMADDADYGLMLWDGVSIETLNAIKEMKNRNKGFSVVLDRTLFDEATSDIIINTLMNR